MKKTMSGFTIVELLIVIVVIAILATISIVAYRGISDRALDSTRQQDIASIKKVLQLYNVQHGGVVRTTTAPRYNPNTNQQGNWDVSINDEWLAFLRPEYGAMPVDPVNEMTDGFADPSTHNAGHKVYFYHCYVASGANGAYVRLGYWRQNGVRVYEDFPVQGCI